MELTAYHPSLRDRIAWGIAGGLGQFGLDKHKQRWTADKIKGLIDFVPGVGEAVGLDDAWNDYQAGNYGLAAAGLGLAAIGAVPGVGDAASNIGRKLARGAFELDYFGQPVRILQNPSKQQLAGFLNRTKYKAARRIYDPRTGEMYVWDANDPALHQLVAEQLGIPIDDQLIMDMIGVD